MVAPKQQLIVFNLVMFMIGVTIIGLVVVPHMRSITQMRLDIAGTQEALEARRAHVVESRRSIQELPVVEAAVQKYQTMTVRLGDELSVITELEGLATEHGIQQQLLPTFVDKKTNKQASYPYYEFQFVNIGTFEQHVQYLRSIELLPYYVTIDSIQFERMKGKQEGAPLLVARFNGRVYATP